MEIPPEVAAPSLAEAITVVDAEAAYRFRNRWLIDVDDRIKHFTYEDSEFVAKRSTITSAGREVSRARQAHHMLQGVRIGSRAVLAAVPELVPLSQDSDMCYLVAEHFGPDMNEQYYRGEEVALPPEDWSALQQIMLSRGMSYDGLLPRNTILTPDQITLIDWEGARFYGRPTTPDSLTRTTLGVSWSYLYGRQATAHIQAALPLDAATEPGQIDFERIFSSFCGYTGDARQLREQVCAIAMAAEADRGHPWLPYKIDDAFHVIGELIPREVEVLMDTLLAARDNNSHYKAALFIAASAQSLHTAGSQGYNEQAVNTFKQRCAKLAAALISTDTVSLAPPENHTSLAQAVDSIAVPTDSRELAGQIHHAISQIYPDAQPDRTTLMSVAHSIRDLASLNTCTKE